MGIKFEKVSFTYPSETKEVKYAVKDISLEIEQCGEFIALIGQTGSGKSTLVQLMNALIRVRARWFQAPRLCVVAHVSA